MAKGKYQRWLEPGGLVLLEGWARDGLTDEQIAAKMGIVPSTLYAWKNRHREISEALKKGKEVVDYAVENALLEKAMGGDVTASIFWLKNRKPDKWLDKHIDSFGDTLTVHYYENLGELFTNIANAIRTKSGQSGEIFACDFPDRIQNL